MTESTYHPWPPAEDDWPDEDGYDVVPAAGDEPPGFLAPIDDMRFVRQSPRTTNDKITYAIHGAYAMPESVWRTWNIVFAYMVATPGHVLCDAVKWALFDRLSRFLLAVPVLLAALFLLNHIPLVAWLVPDQWDVSALFPHDVPLEPGTVQVPLDLAPPEAGE